MKTAVLSLSAIALLSACGGSGGGADLVETTQTLSSEFEAIQSSEGTTPFSQVAVDGGVVIYNGTATVTITPDGSRSADFLAIGEFEATADFGSGQDVEATANNFIQAANPEESNNDLSDFESAGAIDGSFEWDLDIEEFSGVARVVGTATGELTRIDSTQEDFASTSVLGFFYGDNLDFLSFNANDVDPDQAIRLNVIAKR